MKVLSVSEMYTQLKNAGARSDKNTLMYEMKELLDPKIKKTFAQKISGMEFAVGDNFYKAKDYKETLGGRIMRSLGFVVDENSISEKRAIFHPKKEEFGIMSSTYDKQGRLVRRELHDGKVIEVDYSTLPPVTRRYETTSEGLELMTEIEKGAPKSYLTRLDTDVYEVQDFRHLQGVNKDSLELKYKLHPRETLYESQGSFDFLKPERNRLTTRDGKIYELVIDLSEKDVTLVYQSSEKAPARYIKGYEKVNAFLKKMPEELSNDLVANMEGIF